MGAHAALGFGRVGRQRWFGRRRFLGSSFDHPFLEEAPNGL
jgi:hypothetical protein